MTKVTYGANSLYAETPQANQILEYLDFWNGEFVYNSNNDYVITLETKYNNRPDLLSQDLYGTTSWWWIFALYNPDSIQDPIYDMKAGISIRYPNKNNLPRMSGS